MKKRKVKLTTRLSFQPQDILKNVRETLELDVEAAHLPVTMVMGTLTIDGSSLFASPSTSTSKGGSSSSSMFIFVVLW